jgi:signal transduction histidine kinase
MIVYDVINTLLVIILLFNVALLLPILRNVKNNTQTFVYAVNIITILGWLVTMIGYRSQTLFFQEWLRALYVVAIFIGVTYMQFTLYYPIKIVSIKKILYPVWFFSFFLSLLVIFTEKIIINGVKNPQGEPEIIFGQWYILYILAIIIPFTIGFLRHAYILFTSRSKIAYLLVGYLISSNIAFVTNLMLPWFGVFIFNWVGQFFTVVMVSFTTYSILKFNLMNVRFFAVNVGVTLLGIITLSQTLFADSIKDLLVSGFVFFVSTLTGYYLVVLSKNERVSLEKTVHLNKKIQHINEELESANEQLKSLDKLKSEFISLASHQLRSPLTVIKGYASTLSDGVVGELTPKQTEIVRHIYASAQGLSSVVEDFLNVTKIEQGGMKYVFAPTDIGLLVKDLCDDMKIVAEERHLTFMTSIQVEDSLNINVDQTKIKQVFLNIIDNSIKYTKEGFVKVALTKQGKDFIIFSVSDSGVGISKETKEKLFTKFARGEGGVMNSGGSGLGLYLAQEIVKAHHGTIEVSSEGLGKGAVFSVTLPMVTDARLDS